MHRDTQSSAQQPARQEQHRQQHHRDNARVLAQTGPDLDRLVDNTQRPPQVLQPALQLRALRGYPPGYLRAAPGELGLALIADV
jgi:hypothetical protein